MKFQHSVRLQCGALSSGINLSSLALRLCAERTRFFAWARFPLTTAFVACALAMTQTGYAAPFTVNSTADRPDATPGDNRCETGSSTSQGKPECSLRAAIQESNAQPGFPPEHITLPAGTYVLTGGTLEIAGSLTIAGAGAASTIIDGNRGSRIFLISNPGTNPIVNLSGVTIRNGEGGIGFGTGINITPGSSLSLANSVVSDHRSSVGGVGIANSGNLTVFQSTIRNNQVTGGGGGVTGAGGGIFNGRVSGQTTTPVLTIIQSTIRNNQGIRGGGIFNSGSLDMTNSTISGNVASVGGGIRTVGGVTNISFSTITDNAAGLESGEPVANRTGGGIANVGDGQVNIGNTILAGNRDGRIASDPLFSPDCFSVVEFRFTSFRGNLVGIANENCDLRDTIFGAPPPFDMVGSEASPLAPRLAPLGDNGGPTATHPLLNDSPAIDRGTGVTSATFFDCPETDQRGFTRPIDGNRDNIADCDMGAYEFGAIAPVVVNNLVSPSSRPVTSLSTTPTPDGPAGTFFVTVRFINKSTLPIRKPFFQVAMLSGGNVLLNADSGAGGAGATLIPDVGLDRILTPGESFTAEFRIGLQTRNPFRFFVDVMGEPTS